MYWRAHPLLASRCPAALLALSRGRLSLVTADAKPFDVDARTVRGRLTVWGTLRLEIDGRRYSLVSDLGQFAPAFSPSQARTLSMATRSRELRTIAEWPAILHAAGAVVIAPRFDARRWVLGGIVAIVVVTAAVLLALTQGRD